jgi:hypothetical protein
MRLCLERTIAPRRDAEVRFDLPAIRDASDIADAMAAVLRALARSEITPAEGGEIGPLVETFMRAIECADFERRLRAIEANPYPRVSLEPGSCWLGRGIFPAKNREKQREAGGVAKPAPEPAHLRGCGRLLVRAAPSARFRSDRCPKEDPR